MEKKANVDDNLPDLIPDEDALNEILTRPRPVLVEFIRQVCNPLVILGAGGKMGPSLAVLARRAAQAAGYPLEILAASRFSDENTRRWLEDNGVMTLPCDLMQREQLDRLPDAENVIYLVGMKFGTSQNPSRTWAFNTLAPAHVCQRYPGSRMVALSSGNVYPLVSTSSRGAVETDPLTPLGEYANSCIARERIFEYFSQEKGTPIAILRLNYALDLRYGVLFDIARKVFDGLPVDTNMGYANCIWQGDANEAILRSLALARSPAVPFNLTGPQKLSVRELALRFGELMKKPVTITGTEASTALLSNNSRLSACLGEPATPIDVVLKWTAHWVSQGGKSLNKPTHFDVRDGGY